MTLKNKGRIKEVSKTLFSHIRNVIIIFKNKDRIRRLKIKPSHHLEFVQAFESYFPCWLTIQSNFPWSLGWVLFEWLSTIVWTSHFSDFLPYNFVQIHSKVSHISLLYLYNNNKTHLWGWYLNHSYVDYFCHVACRLSLRSLVESPSPLSLSLCEHVRKKKVVSPSIMMNHFFFFFQSTMIYHT